METLTYLRCQTEHQDKALVLTCAKLPYHKDECAFIDDYGNIIRSRPIRRRRKFDLS